MLNYLCEHCLVKYNESNFQKLEITYNGKKCLQCKRCFIMGAYIKVYNYDELYDCESHCAEPCENICTSEYYGKNVSVCAVCKEPVGKITLFNCHHWICTSCTGHLQNNVCPICSSEIVARCNIVKRIIPTITDQLFHPKKGELLFYLKILYLDIYHLNFNSFSDQHISVIKAILIFVQYLDLSYKNKNLKFIPGYLMRKIWQYVVLSNLRNYKNICHCLYGELIDNPINYDTVEENTAAYKEYKKLVMARRDIINNITHLPQYFAPSKISFTNYFPVGVYINGIVYTPYITATHKIKDIKHRIWCYNNDFVIESAIYKDVVMEDDKTLPEYGVKSRDVIKMKLKGAEPEPEPESESEAEAESESESESES